VKTDDYVKQAVVQLLALRLRTGESVAQLRKFAEACLEQAANTTSQGVRNRGLDIHRLGSILRSWHKETKYLTHDGLPRPLKANGKAGLKSLVRRFYPSEKYDLVFTRLVEAGLIKQFGVESWIPSDRTARIPKLSQETLEHLAEGVVRYVETVINNVTANDESNVLFERSCKVTKLPMREYAAFREFAEQQALAFLTGIDDWLESRNARRKLPRSQLCTAGVYTFAFVAGKGNPRISKRS
jgi:hypothetical protein